MGINVKAVKIKAFMFVGIGAALAGIFSTLITYTFFPTQGFGYLLLALAAVFVGGTPYWGGLGTIVGAVFGAFVISYMEVGVVAVGMSGTWRQFFNGLIILAIIFFNTTMNIITLIRTFSIIQKFINYIILF